jgi:hypothetical protein
MNIPHYPHRRVPWDATGRLQARPCGDAHPRACGRGPGISPPWPSAARVAPAYRIYSEEEFLAAEDWQGEAEPEFALLGQAGPQREPRRWGGLAALAALTSVVAAVVGVVALTATRSKPQGDRRIAARGGSSPEIVADRPSVRPLDAHPRKRLRRASVAVRRAAEHRLLPADRPLTTAHPYLPPEPPSPAPTPAPVPVNAPASAKATAAAATSAPAPARGADAEFGFERR